VTGAPTADLLPHGRLLVYVGAPHGLYRTEQGRLNDDLLAFVGELPARVTDAGAGAVEDISSRTTSTG